jgi:hypothetical protein
MWKPVRAYFADFEKLSANSNKSFCLWMAKELSINRRLKAEIKKLWISASLSPHQDLSNHFSFSQLWILCPCPFRSLFRSLSLSPCLSHSLSLSKRGFQTQEAKYVESWPNTTSAWAGWSRFDIPVDRYVGVHSLLICTSSTLGCLTCHQAN